MLYGVRYTLLLGSPSKQSGLATAALHKEFSPSLTLRMLADDKIGDQELREGFLSAPQVRHVLGRN
jgi:hypothetical protein